jgi:arginase
VIHEIDRRDWDLLVSPWHLDERIDGFPVPDAAIELTSPPSATTSGLRWMREHYLLTADATARTNRPLLLSGDCLTALGVAAGLQRRHDDVAVVWLDAHGDFNTPETTTSGYLAGMSLAMLTGRSPKPLCEPLGLRPVSDDQVVLLDARDLDPEERGALEASRVRRVAADTTAVREALSYVSASAVYLHVDVDIVDGADLPGLRFPVAAGPTFSRVEECLVEIAGATNLVGACIACAWLPERIGHEVTRHAIGRIADALGVELRWPASGENRRRADATGVKRPRRSA